MQNSVFECNIDEAQFVKLKTSLSSIIDKNVDSLRFYNLGNNYSSKIIHVGAKETYDPRGVLLI